MSKRKVLALFVSTLMIMGVIAGCAQTAAPETLTPSPTQAQPADTASPAPTVETPSAPVTITFGSSLDYFPSDPNWLEYENFQKMFTDLNMKIDYTYYDSDKFSLMLASGDIPDMVLGLQSFLPQIVDNKLALDMDPYLKEYAPNMLLDIYTQRNDLVRNLMGGPDKALYFYAPCIGMENSSGGQESKRGYNIRWDYYKEIGCPEINGDDDYLNVIKTIANIHPETANGDKIFGMGLYDSLNVWYERAPFTTACGMNLWAFSGYQYMADLKDNMLFNGYVNTDRSAYWIDMRFYHKAYLMGILDPDSFTMTAEEQTEKIKKGKYIITPGSAAGALYNEMVKADPNTLAKYVIIPTNANVVFSDNPKPTGQAPTLYLFISASSKNFKTVLAFLNYMHDPENGRMLNNGIKGKYWNYDNNGVPYLFDSTIALKASGSDEVIKAGIRGGDVQWLICPWQRGALAPDGYAYSLFDDKKYLSLGLTPAQKDYCSHYSVDYPSQAALKFVKDGTALDMSKSYAQTISAGVNGIPNDIQRIMNGCNDIIYRAIPKLVMAKNDEEFNAVQAQVLNDLKAAGEEQAWQWCQSAYNGSKAVVDPVMK